ncbi:MAG: hypothetical protein COA90_02235 [Gammaproteobacteria bacterium]|nr:MAG: hypothetical protein COA90_02235 [Gammaproteobacteria bacterium]
MFESLNSIPIAIWSVALGSLITLLGVLISNINNRKQLEIQLKHDAEIRTIERKAAMRREVYLSAAEELVKANNYIGSLSQIDLVKTNIAEGLQGFFTSATKLELIAEQETGKASNDLVLAYSGLLFRLLAKVSPINDLRTDIDIINYHYDESQIEIKRVLAAMNAQNESGAPNEAVFSALNKSFEFQSKRSKELTDERDECWERVNELTSKFTVEVAEEMKSMALLQIPVMVGIRKELDIETNLKSYRQQVVNSTEILSKQLDEFISVIEK